MRSLAETQSLFRRAVSGEPTDQVLALLKAPADPLGRLEIYRRHYREGFRRHLRGRYPTVEWLVGTDVMIELADALLRDAPPRAPSLAEFGDGLIDIVAGRSDTLPAWLADVATLDWHLGILSVETAQPALEITSLQAIAAQHLPDLSLTLQPSVYLQSEWPVDELVHLRLQGSAPEQLQFEPQLVYLELRGGRGRFALNRLTPAGSAFRRSLGEGLCLAMAAERALAAEQSFDLSAALAGLFADGLVTTLITPTQRIE